MSISGLTPLAPEALRERLVEISSLPEVNRQPLNESAIIDLVCVNTESGTISSMNDAVMRSEQLLWKWFHKSQALVASGIINRVARALLVDNISSLVPDSTKLGNLLRKLVTTRDQRVPISTFVQRPSAGDEPAFLGLSMRIPEIEDSDGGSLANLALLIKFACAVTGANQKKVKVIKDPLLGNKTYLSAFHQKWLNEVVVAASHSQGVCTSPVYKVKTGYEANPVEMLGMLHMLNQNMHLVRKSGAPKGKSALHLEPSEVREAFNTHLGLKTQGEGTWVLQFLKESLAYSVRANTNTFPGGFVHAAKKRLQSASTLGALQKMGWTPLVPSHLKANVVVYNTTEEQPNKKFKIVRKKEEDVLDYSEHRLMVALCLPKIDPKSSVPLDEQVRRDPLGVWPKGTLKAFGTQKFQALVNALTLTHNIFNSVSDTKTKAEPVHFKNVRNETLNRSAHVPLLDGLGTEYPKFSDIPEHVRKWLQSKYRFKHQSSKRPAPEEDAKMEGQEATPSLPSTSVVAPPPQKKQKSVAPVNRGQLATRGGSGPRGRGGSHASGREGFSAPSGASRSFGQGPELVQRKLDEATELARGAQGDPSDGW
ncbi:hypothetical protein [Hortiboletus rubellus ormycovirus 1]